MGAQLTQDRRGREPGARILMTPCADSCLSTSRSPLSTQSIDGGAETVSGQARDPPSSHGEVIHVNDLTWQLVNSRSCPGQQPSRFCLPRE